jgi:uncharacterized protein HemY
MYLRRRLPKSEYCPNNFNALLFRDKYERRLYKSLVMSFSHIFFLPILLSILSLKSRLKARGRMARHWNKKNKRCLVGLHDKEASSSRGQGHLSRVEKEARAIEEIFGSTARWMKLGR